MCMVGLEEFEEAASVNVAVVDESLLLNVLCCGYKYLLLCNIDVKFDCCEVESMAGMIGSIN